MKQEGKQAQIKGSILRGIFKELAAKGMLERVAEGSSPAVRQLIERPPPASEWVDTVLCDEMGSVVERIAGAGTWRRVSRDAVLHGFLPLIRTGLEGFLRLFGATPPTIFTRMSSLVGMGARGVEYEYAALTASSGVMRVTYSTGRDVAIANFHGVAGGLEAVFDLLRTKGEVGEPELVANGLGNSAKFPVSWIGR